MKTLSENIYPEWNNSQKMTENLISAPVVEVQKFPPSVELENFQLKLLEIIKIYKKKNCQFNYSLKIENRK